MEKVAASSNRKSGQWRVELDADDEAAYAALAADRLWNGYSIADLEPPFRAHSRFAIASAGGATRAACLFLTHPAFSSAIPDGDPAGLAAILAEADLPPTAYLLARPEHLPVFERCFAAAAGLTPMLRMAVDRSTYRPPAREEPSVEPLRLDDVPLLLDLYTDHEVSAFNPDQLQVGPFYGVRRDGRLLAAGGVHTVSRTYRIGAAGNFFTRPEARGRGYGTAVVAAVVGDLLAGACEDVILNVAAANEGAQRVYRRLGFRAHCEYLEGRIVRR